MSYFSTIQPLARVAAQCLGRLRCPLSPVLSLGSLVLLLALACLPVKSIAYDYVMDMRSVSPNNLHEADDFGSESITISIRRRYFQTNATYDERTTASPYPLYLSTDSHINSNDTPLLTNAGAAGCAFSLSTPKPITSYNDSNYSINCKLPTNTEAGQYYIGVCIQNPGSGDSDSGNNCSTGKSFQVRSSFDWQSMNTLTNTAPTSDNLNLEISFTETVTNTGGTDAPATRATAYLIEPSPGTAKTLCSKDIPIIDQGDSYTYSMSCSLAAADAPAPAEISFAVCISTDSDDEEANASNNCGVYQKITIPGYGFDAQVTSVPTVNLQSLGTAENLGIFRFSSSIMVHNSGVGWMPKGSTGVAKFFPSESLSGNGGKSFSLTTIPDHIAAGGTYSLSLPPTNLSLAGLSVTQEVYYAGICIESIIGYEANTVGNCSSAIAVTIPHVDWRVAGKVSINKAGVVSSDMIVIAATVQNTGTINSPLGRLKFYWSEDVTISEDDLSLCGDTFVDIPAINPTLNTGALSQSCSVPGSLTVGDTYYIGACVLDTSTDEIDSDNNCSSGLAVLVRDAIQLDLTSDTVDVIDATLLLRGIRLTQGQRNSLVSGQTSNIVAAGYQNLLAGEVDIVGQIDALLNTDPPVLDLTGDNVVDIIDATLLLRGIRLTKSQRASLVSGETSNIVVAGYTNLLESEAAIVAQISTLLGE